MNTNFICLIINNIIHNEVFDLFVFRMFYSDMITRD